MEQKLEEPKQAAFDTNDFEFPETLFVRDIEDKVFQGIVLHCLARIEGISLDAGGFLDNILGGSLDGLKGVTAEQDSKSQSISVKVEVNVDFGISLPNKAQEIQSKITEEITNMTGLHVSSVHVIFKSIQPVSQDTKLTIKPIEDEQVELPS